MFRLPAAALATAAVVLVGSAAPAMADTESSVRAAVQSWQTDGPGIYVAPPARGKPLSNNDVRRIDAAVDEATTPLYVAALAEKSRAQGLADLREVIDRANRHGTYVVVGTGGFVAASDVAGVEGSTDSLVDQATADPGASPADNLVEFVRLVDAAASSGSVADEPLPAEPGADTAGSNDSGGSPWVALLVLGGFGALVIGLLRRRRNATDREDAAQLAEVSRAADEDVTVLGEELTALDVPPAAAPEANRDYQAALDSYDRAKQSLSRARRPADLAAVTSALEEGRWRLACVRARLAGRPLPERRPPCFFNPRHGPSTEDVSWAPPGGAPRTVPVCAADADRVARGADPDARMVDAGGRMVPYWQGPAYYGPYAGGFFGGWGGGSFLGGLLLGELLTAPMAYGDSGYGAGYDAGYDAGQDADGGDADGGDFAGGFDVGGGGWDDSGGWGGGGDFGGGDFGGGDGGW